MLGIDIGPTSATLVEMTAGSAGPRVCSWARQPLPADAWEGESAQADALESALRDLVEQSGAVGREVVLGLPDNRVHYANVRLPSMPHDEMSRAAEWEGRERFADIRGPLEVRHIRAGTAVSTKDKAKEEVLVIGVSNAVIDSHVTALDRAGLVPIAVEIRPVALARFIAATTRDYQPDESTRIALDIENGSSRLLIVSDRRIVFFHTLQIEGGDSPTGDSPCTDPAELADEIALKQFMPGLRHFAVTFRGGRPDKVLMSGAGWANEGMRTALSRRLGVALVPADALSVWGPPVRERALPEHGWEWTIPVGLALRGLRKGSGIREVAA